MNKAIFIKLSMRKYSYEKLRSRLIMQGFRYIDLDDFCISDIHTECIAEYSRRENLLGRYVLIWYVTDEKAKSILAMSNAGWSVDLKTWRRMR